jgi:L,D-peptidoglycan transpeptidase YkuD (ErfK/YbiS/YcfS/YnhG family)
MKVVVPSWRTWAALSVTALTVAALTACGSSGRTAGRAAPTSAAPVSGAAVSPAPPTSGPSTPTVSGEAASTARTAPPRASTVVASTTTAPRPAVSQPPDPKLAEAGPAGQAIIVTAAGYGATTATFTAYRRSTQGWQQLFGPWVANLGIRGLAPPGAKREGDGRTPSGAYGLGFFFGTAPDPGVRFAYRQVTGPSIVWDDDPSSPRYNEWVDASQADPGANAEPMDRPAYQYGAVVAYNTARTPGLGSAIFLHVSTGGPTAGCISIPVAQLLEVLRWLDPGQQPRIIVGTTSG